jgi:hypothetical protein
VTCKFYGTGHEPYPQLMASLLTSISPSPGHERVAAAATSQCVVLSTRGPLPGSSAVCRAWRSLRLVVVPHVSWSPLENESLQLQGDGHKRRKHGIRFYLVVSLTPIRIKQISGHMYFIYLLSKLVMVSNS